MQRLVHRIVKHAHDQNAFAGQPEIGEVRTSRILNQSGERKVSARARRRLTLSFLTAAFNPAI
jgi:hypothetical protein